MKHLVSYVFVAIAAVVITTLPLDAGYRSKQHHRSSKHQEHKGMRGSEKDIATLAIATDDLSTLVTALKAADLVSVLQGQGPFTVFAPTNEAFAALGGTLDELLKPENKEKLKAILLYHVVPGKVMSNEISDMDAKTASGDKLSIRLVNGKVMVDDATVIKADIKASNGVVHVIDKVVTP